MGFTYIIGEAYLNGVSLSHLRKPTYRTSQSGHAEHMEEDDPTPLALPRWIELEYKVGVVTSRAMGQQVLTTISSHTISRLSHPNR